MEKIVINGDASFLEYAMSSWEVYLNDVDTTSIKEDERQMLASQFISLLDNIASYHASIKMENTFGPFKNYDKVSSHPVFIQNAQKCSTNGNTIESKRPFAYDVTIETLNF